MAVCNLCKRGGANPGSGLCSPCEESEMIRGKAAAYDRMRSEQFISASLAEAGLARDDRRIDYTNPDSFRRSVAEARLEDMGESVWAREQELEAREQAIKSQEIEFPGTPRAKPKKKSAKDSEIEAKKARLAQLKQSGGTAEAYRLLREIEALENE